MSQDITVDVAITSELQIPVSVSHKILLTKEAYLAIENPTRDTEYFCTEILSNGQKIVGEVYQGPDLMYSAHIDGDLMPDGSGGEFILVPVLVPQEVLGITTADDCDLITANGERYTVMGD